MQVIPDSSLPLVNWIFTEGIDLSPAELIGADEFDPAELVQLSERKAFDLKVYHAIANENITLSFTLIQDVPVQINLVNLSGKMLKQLLYQQLYHGSYQYQFEVNEFIPGVYIIQLNAEQNSAIIRIVIAR